MVCWVKLIGNKIRTNYLDFCNVIIDDADNLIVFPTTSPLSDDCIWISLKRVKNFKKLDACNTKIVFDNNKEIIVPCSFRTIENQVSRASRLDLIMRNRRKH